MHRPQTVKNFCYTEKGWGKKRKYYQFTLIPLQGEWRCRTAHRVLPSPGPGGTASLGAAPGGHAEHSSHKRSGTLTIWGGQGGWSAAQRTVAKSHRTRLKWIMTKQNRPPKPATTYHLRQTEKKTGHWWISSLAPFLLHFFQHLYLRHSAEIYLKEPLL